MKTHVLQEFVVHKLDSRTKLIVTLKVTNEFKIRMFLGLLFMKIACFIMGCGIDINYDGEVEDSDLELEEHF